MNRRFFLLSGCAALLLPALPAQALTESAAKSLVDTLVADINKVIASGKGESAMFKDFERIFARYSDTAAIAAYAMGADGRRASNGQKKAFSKAFQGYIARKYGKRFREFVGGQIEVNGVKKVKNWFEVSATARLQNQSPFTVTFLVSDRSGKPLFFNMFIEGVNLLLAERKEVGAVLDRNSGDIDAMIETLKRSG